MEQSKVKRSSPDRQLESGLLLPGKTALVTGAAQGLGRAIALALARQGAEVVVNDVAHIEAGQALAAEIRSLGRRSSFAAGDVSQKPDVTRLVSAVVEQLGRLDILINNAAAFGDFTLAFDLAEGDWDRVVRVNLKGAYLCAQAAAQAMRGQGSGVILNLSSAGSHLPMSGDAAYVASKGGLEALTRALAVDLGPSGIRALAVAPGHCDTDENLAWLASDPVRPAGVLARIPLGRLAHKEEIAALVAFLVSDACPYLTGQTVVVDGGLSVWGGDFQ